MFYIKLNSNHLMDPVVIEKAPIGAINSWTLYEIAKKELNTDCAEQVMPVGLNGEFGFYIDDNAIESQHDINPVASILYGTPDHGHPIMGDAFIGKLERDSLGACLGLMDDEQLEKVILLINEAILRKGGEQS